MISNQCFGLMQVCVCKLKKLVGVVLGLFFAFVLCGEVYASRCDTTRARRVAYGFCVGELHGGVSFGADDLELVSPKFGFSDVYIFNLPENGGFVVVAGDDCMHPIVGYGFDGPLSMVGENMRWWLEGCERMARVARGEGREASAEVVSEWRGYENSGDGSSAMGEDRMESGGGIPALMATRWNQSPLYNDSCPYDAL